MGPHRALPHRAGELRGRPGNRRGTLPLRPGRPPFLERKEDLVGDLPVHVTSERLVMDLQPHSVVFVTIEAQ